MGIDHGHQQKVCRKTNLEIFRSLYGSNPVVYAQIWEDLQTTEIEDARLTTSEANKGLDSFIAAAAISHDRSIYPKEDANETGTVRWEGSEAERLLRLDMDAGKHESMAPRLLYEERSEYKEFPLQTFRGHIYNYELGNFDSSMVQDGQKSKLRRRCKRKNKSNFSITLRV
jgi:hypothetical protein